jgi:hypothetical protein
MRNVSSMSDAEIRERLKFTRRWFDLGIVDDAGVALAVREFRESDDQGDEHYRYGAFVHFLRRHPTLTPRQCRELFDLGAGDPDRPMGTSIMLDILRRPECPDDLYELAAAHSRTAQYAAEMKRRHDFDPVKHRQGLQALGTEGYYRAYGFREDGRRRKDQTVYKEMRDLFGIDFTRFHEIKHAADRPAG